MYGTSLLAIVPGAVAIATIAAAPARAVTTADGVVLITQAAALAGGVTPGDAPGYPISITVSGSYRLASDLTGAAGYAGIAVTSRNVTLDFNGFTLRGGNVGAIGVRSDVGALTVKNGSIQFFTLDGISSYGPGLRVENMSVVTNGRAGIHDRFPQGNYLDGRTIIRNNIVSANQDGIICQAGCLVEGNVVTSNRATGIVQYGFGSSVLNNIINSNGNYGVDGNLAGLGGNTIMDNGFCHTAGSIVVTGKNAIHPPSSGASCPVLPGN